MDRDSITVASSASIAVVEPLATHLVGRDRGCCLAATRSSWGQPDVVRLGHCLPAAPRYALGVEFNMPWYGLLTELTYGNIKKRGLLIYGSQWEEKN
jgi:hypothetical protein